MRKLAKKMNNTLFDVAAGPLFIVLFGIPILILVVVIILIVVTIRLIKRARKKNTEVKESPEENTPAGQDH